MITRIVKMTFKPERIPEFLETFERYKERIASAPGCIDVTLLQGTSDPAILMTYSHWNDEADLERYRHSELFKEVWALTKVHFDDKPMAWSLSTVAGA